MLHFITTKESHYQIYLLPSITMKYLSLPKISPLLYHYQKSLFILKYFQKSLITKYLFSLSLGKISPYQKISPILHHGEISLTTKSLSNTPSHPTNLSWPKVSHHGAGNLYFSSSAARFGIISRFVKFKWLLGVMFSFYGCPT